MTKLIQFIGPQCIGKTTMAAGLFYVMKKDGLQVELIQEPARRRVYAGLPLEGAGQLSLIADLYEHISDVVRAGVPWVVMDTHILTPLLYTEDDMVWELCYSLFTTLTDTTSSISIIPIGERPIFTGEGRAYTEEEGNSIPTSSFNFIKDVYIGCYSNNNNKLEVPHTIEAVELYQKVLEVSKQHTI